jgi:hypothetical protein
MTGRWQAGSGQALGWLPAVAALACIALAGCGHAAASDTTAGTGTAACANTRQIDSLTIDRRNPLHQNFHFVAPGADNRHRCPSSPGRGAGAVRASAGGARHLQLPRRLGHLLPAALCRPPPLVPARHRRRHRMQDGHRPRPGPLDLRRVRLLERPGQSRRPRSRQPCYLRRHAQNLTGLSSPDRPSMPIAHRPAVSRPGAPAGGTG